MPENICRNTTGPEDETIQAANDLIDNPHFVEGTVTVRRLIEIIKRLDKALSQKDDEATEASNRAFEAENTLGSLKQKLTELAG